MARTPLKLSPVDLFPKFLDRTEYLLMLIKEIEKLLEHFWNVLVDPVLVLKFDYDAVCIDICKVLLANFYLFQTVEKHQHDSHDFLRVEIIENLANFFDDSSVIVLEVLQTVFVETKNPKHCYDMVSNLWFAKAWSLE